MPIRKTKAAASGLLWLASCVLNAGSGHAQSAPASPEPPGVVSEASAAAPAREAVIALQVAPELVDAAALRAALEAELGVGVLDAAYATAGMPMLQVTRVSAENVEVALSSRSLPRASREIALTAQRPEERVQIVAFIAANLVRNEAASLLPDLRPVDPSAASAPSVPPKPPVVSPCDLHGEAAFGIDFAPGVGASSTKSGRAATRRLSLGFAGTLSSRLHGLEFSLGVSTQRVSVCGAQLAVGASITRGPVSGLQGALFSTAKGVSGAQGGIVAVNVGEFTGMQGGIVTVNTGFFRGAQGGVVTVNTGSFIGAHVGVVTYTGGDHKGLQAGVANASVGTFTGLQAGVANVNIGALYGVQVGLANTNVGQGVGAQLGLANYAGGVGRGAQLGVANISADGGGAQVGIVNIIGSGSRGTQVGVFNYADSSRASIGLLSIVRRGRTSLDVLAAVETGGLTFGVTHGGKYVHNSYAIGPRFSPGNERALATFALGVRVFSNARLRIDIDAVTTTYLGKDMGSYNTSIGGLRVPVTLMLVEGFGLVAGPSYQVMVTDNPNTKTQSIFGDQIFHRDQDTSVRGYAGLTLGLRYEFDHGLSATSGQASGG